jgi:hypothetical protein
MCIQVGMKFCIMHHVHVLPLFVPVSSPARAVKTVSLHGVVPLVLTTAATPASL